LARAGVLLSREECERAAELTQRAGAWLVMDNTYEHFVYDGRQHHCVSAPHIIHIFSFSKAPSRPSLPACGAFPLQLLALENFMKMRFSDTYARSRAADCAALRRPLG
jgi:hypothetical protein